MGYSYAYEIEEMIQLGLLPALFSSVPSMAMGIAAYVLTALAYYTVANRRGLKNAWLAWIPVANLWLLGSISDQYRYVVKGEYKSKRKILLGLGIASMVCAMVVMGLVISLVVSGISGAMGGISQEQMMGRLMGRALGMLGLVVPMLGIAIAQMVIRYMALYDVYMSLDPSNSVMFLVLSILFGVTEPFFLFFNRTKDEGMPPRKQQPVYEQPVYQAPQEPWNSNGPDYL